MSADLEAMILAMKNPVAASRTNTGFTSEYSQAYGNVLPKEKRVKEPKLTWKKRNHSTILLPSSFDSPSKENIRPTKSKQSWPWKERAQSSQIFGPFKDVPVKVYKQKWPWDERVSKPYLIGGESSGGSGDFVKSICKDAIERTISLIDAVRPLKSKKKWPWQERSCSTSYLFGSPEEISKESHVDGSSDNCTYKPSTKKVWPWQKRAMTSEIFANVEDKDIVIQIPKKRQYNWNQRKSTHDHKVDSDGKLEGISQYKKDFCLKDSSNLNEYLGPRHGYRYLLSRRESAASVIQLPPEKTSPAAIPEENEEQFTTSTDMHTC